MTTDAYSFSKQVTENIGQYFWRRDGISNTCLRFGAGLRPMEEIKRTHGEGYAEVRQFAEALLQMDTDVAAKKIRRMRDAYDKERRDRCYEQKTGKTPELGPVEHRMMSLRHNYFSFVSLEDACRSMELSLVSSFKGSHALFILDQMNVLMLDAARLADLVYLGVPINGLSRVSSRLSIGEKQPTW